MNKLETRVELWFDIAASVLLTAAEKALLYQKWQAKLASGTTLHLYEQSARTQLKNKELIIAKFYRLLAQALKKDKPRKATKPKRSAIEARLKSKKITAERKDQRKNFF